MSRLLCATCIADQLQRADELGDGVLDSPFW